MEAEEFIKSKGLDINHYVIMDMSYNYRSQIPICIWLDEFAEQQNKELIEENENFKLVFYQKLRFKLDSILSGQLNLFDYKEIIINKIRKFKETGKSSDFKDPQK